MLAFVLCAGFVGGPSAVARSQLARARPLADVSHVPPPDMPGGTSMPPSALGEAWVKADLAKELAERLQGCSVHLIGHRTPEASSTSLALARRLKEHRYRFLDLDAIVGEVLKANGLGQDAPTDEVRSVEKAVLEEAKAWSRSILLAAGEPGSQAENYAALHQGVVVLLASPSAAEPAELWVENADVSITLKAGASPDESALLVASEVLRTLRERPPKSEAWRKKREDTLKERGIDPDSYDTAANP
ncbi:hypothetical protein T492DRAFT_1013246 [Pavlovales sp. CCMP2436]|nr:hypothetical protein T492DRAFT_1013246 [Pavlovales sp. CCMP2436]